MYRSQRRKIVVAPKNLLKKRRSTMKKTLALLTLSLLLVCAMILGVSATTVGENAEAGIGSYICFDDQATVKAYTTSSNGDISYDPDEGALKFDNFGNYVSAAYDNNLNIIWPNTFNNANYPVVRITYKSVVTNKDGTSSGSGARAYMWTVGTSCTSGDMEMDNNGNKAVIYHSNWSGDLNKNTNRSRLDMPNVQGSSFDDANYVTYIYDIGFFKDQATAEAYTCETEASTDAATWTVTVNGVKNVEDATIAQHEDDAKAYTITLPYGTNVTNIELDYGITAMVGDDKYDGIFVADAITLQEGAVNTHERVEYKAGNISAYVTNGTAMELAAYCANVFVDGGYKIYFEVADSGMTDEEIVAKIQADLASEDVMNAVKNAMASVTEKGGVAGAITALDEVKAIVNSFPGSKVGVKCTEFTAPTAATATADGVEGTVEFQFMVTYGTLKNQASEKITVTIPALPFRILYMFNDQDAANLLSIDAGAALLKLNDDAKAPVVTEGGKTFVRFQVKDGGNSEIYFRLGTYITKAIAESGDFDYLVDLDQYKYVVINYNASATLPGNQHIYWETDYHHINHTGYEWAKHMGFWSFSMKKSVTNEALLLNNTDDFKGDYPWTGKLTALRMNVTKNSTYAANDYFDLNYIAFFASKDDAEAFIANPTPAFTLSDAQKAAINALTFEEANGATVSGETAAKAHVLAIVEEALAEEGYSDIAINTVSFEGANVETDTKGTYKFTVTAKMGDTVGDRDVFTSDTLTLSISVPVYTVDTAIATIEDTDFGTLNGVYSEATAKAYVEKALSEIKAAYVGYTFAVNGVIFEYPSETEDGSYKFNVTVNGEKTTANITIVVKAAVRPIVYNFASPLMVYNTSFVGGDKVEIVEDASALGGAYTKFTRTAAGTEFNLQIAPNTNGNPAIAELAKYPVVLYRYKAPGHGNYQIYYYTSTAKGHTYQQFNPSKPVDEWNYHIWETVAGQSTSTEGSVKWEGKVANLRFDFFRGNKSENLVLELDYIGLFANVEQAKAFAENPWLDEDATASDLSIKYETEINAINSTDTAPVFANNGNLGQSIVDFATEKGAMYDFYYIVKSSTAAVDGTAENIAGTPGSITFSIVFAGSANNGNCYETKEITAIIAPNPYTNASTSVEVRTEDNGLRFKTVITKDWMKVAQEYGSITYGTLIAPTAALGDKQLTLDTDLGDVAIANVEGVYHFAEDEDSITYTAVVTDIPEAENATSLTARAYAVFNFMGNDYVVYFDAVASSLADLTADDAGTTVTPDVAA